MYKIYLSHRCIMFFFFLYRRVAHIKQCVMFMLMLKLKIVCCVITQVKVSKTKSEKSEYHRGSV